MTIDSIIEDYINILGDFKDTQRRIAIFNKSLVDNAVKNGIARVETTDEVYYGLKVNIMYLLKDGKDLCGIEYVYSPQLKGANNDN